jgi:short-subunit dehydrogenase
MKKAIVVGATSGIGRGLAEILVENGYKVGIAGRRTELLNEIKGQNEDAYITKTIDVTKIDILGEKLNEMVDELCGLDLFVISSGTGNRNLNFTYELEKPAVDVNVVGFTYIADWAFDFFSKQKQGQIVAITSVAGIRGLRFSPSYSASKAYQINYLESLEAQFKKNKTPITLTEIRPGFVRTDLVKGDDIFWVASVEKAVKQMYKAIVSKKRLAYITKRWAFIGCVMKILPRFIFQKV